VLVTLNAGRLYFAHHGPLSLLLPSKLQLDKEILADPDTDDAA
jgi:hypothetical protein